jgi:hypothetical protein
MTNLEFVIQAFGLDSTDPVHIDALDEAIVKANRFREFMDRQDAALIDDARLWVGRFTGLPESRARTYPLPMTDPRELSDVDLVAAYQRTDGEPGNAEADAMAAEIQRRNLDL